MALQTFLDLVKSPGASLILLAIGLWWLNKKLDKAETRATNERNQAEARVIAERDAFRAERDKRIALLEAEVMECKADRRSIREETAKVTHQHREEMNSLQQEVRALMRAQITQLSKES